MATMTDLEAKITALKASTDAQKARVDSAIQTLTEQSAALQATIDALKANQTDPAALDAAIASLQDIQQELDAEAVTQQQPLPPDTGAGETPVSG